MQSVLPHMALWLGAVASLAITSCGGGSAPSQNPPPTKSTPTVTVTPSSPSITTAQSLTVTVAVSGGSGNPTPTGTVILTSGTYASRAMALVNGSVSITIPAVTLPAGNDTLTASYVPDTASSSSYNSASGAGSVTVTAVPKITPAVTVTPSLPSITTAQSLTVTVAVSGGNGNPTPTGAVVLTSGNYASAAAALNNGGVSINIPAGSLATGSITLSVSYTPDAASSSTYNGATGTGVVTVTSNTQTFTLTVNSVAPSSGITIGVSPQDNSGAQSGTTGFARTYNAGTDVTLNAPISFGSYTFVSWEGCTSNPSASICDVTMNSATTVTATYNGAQINSITVSPNNATIGSQVQFVATVTGVGNFSKSVTWSVAAPSGSSFSPGNISATGLYTTPYPAPATVTVTATSAQDTTKSGSVVVTLSQPAAATGPALTVDAGNQTHVISPYIYGMNGYLFDQASAVAASPGIVRWGGDDISRYNYQTNTTNSASDYYFENFTGAASMFGGGNFTGLIATDNTLAAATLGTVPVLGWVSNGTVGACSFSQLSFPDQTSFNGTCGSGIYPDGTAGCTNAGGCEIYGSNSIAQITSIQEPPPAPPAASAATTSWARGTWAGGWVNSVLSAYGPGNPAAGSGKGVAIWDLDNEPTWWDAVHRDVHPFPFTYDEVTNGGIGTALAIKTVDATAQVGGPVIDNWWAYFYSKEDIESGWNTGPCYSPWSNPLDRTAHGGIPFIEYYLKQMATAETTYGKRLLDYLVLHTYFAADYNGQGVGLTTAGDTAEQLTRLNSTRVFWDPTYTDPNYSQPNYVADSNYTSSCNPPVQAPQVIPMMKTWVAADYPGTKLAIDEYNFGGLESINGAVTQADILGIFGREGLDLGALWPTEAYSAQVPGNMAFAIFRNYDGNRSMFGETALASTSTSSTNADGEGQLAVYGALRSSDGAITVVVINKTYGDLTSALTLANFTSSSNSAKAYLYNNANLNAIVARPDVTVNPPASGSTASNIATRFPAQSVTLLIVPK